MHPSGLHVVRHHVDAPGFSVVLVHGAPDRSKNFAHVVHLADGWPPAYARAAGTPGPCNVLTFRSTGLELEALGAIGHPYFRPVWGTRWNPSVAGLVLDATTDWDEVAELVTDSYCLVAPGRLSQRAPRPRGAGPGRR